jgi:hypothetical protein
VRFRCFIRENFTGVFVHAKLSVCLYTRGVRVPSTVARPGFGSSKKLIVISQSPVPHLPLFLQVAAMKAAKVEEMT